MKLKLAICDDDAKQRDYLTDIVTAWGKKNRHLIELKQYISADSFLFDYEEEKDFDILLLDVEMPGRSGVELAKEVRKDNQAVQLIFITGFYEYFSDGFDVSALHYLIKPADAAKLTPVLDKAVGNLTTRMRSVLLSTSEGDVKLSLADIIYVEAENVYLNIHATHGNYRTRMTLGKFFEGLDDTFFKVHRSFLVNLKYVKLITRTDVTMTSGAIVPLSRGVYHDIHAALVKYL